MKDDRLLMTKAVIAVLVSLLETCLERAVQRRSGLR